MSRSSSSTRGTASASRPAGTPRLRRLLGISRFVLAVNKMDLVDFDEAVFDSTCADFSGLLGDAQLHAIPLSALHGDNVITRSDRTPWFDGFSLLEYLETVDVDGEAAGRPFRFPVQLARPSRSRLPRLRGADRVGHDPRGRSRSRSGPPAGRRASGGS